LQKNGHLIAIEVDSFKVAFISEGLDKCLGMSEEQIFSMDFQMVFGADFLKNLKDFSTSHKNYVLVRDLLEFNNSSYKGILSKSKGYLLIELEEILQLEDYYKDINSDLGTMDEAVRVFENSTTLAQLVNNAASMLQEYTGFDRVMVYRFEENGDGKVIAEDKKFGLEPFLNLQYPATDIPQQARILYLKNKVRAIYDVDDEGKAIYARDSKHAGEQLDLTHSVFRSVSPVHLQYLRNMGVKSTHGVSLIIGKKLWGMLLCQHYSEPKFLHINQRLTTQIFGDLLSNRISLLAAEEKNNEMDLLNEIMHGLSLSHHDELGLAINEQWDQISGLFACDGYYLSSRLGASQRGEEVTAKQMETVESAMDFNVDSLYVTKSLAHEGLDNLQEFPYAGFLRMTISSENEEYLYLLRKEKKKTIEWAGNPEKPFDDPDTLSPRNSFSKWEQKVEGETIDWDFRTIGYANLLRDAVISFQVEKIKEVYGYTFGKEEATRLLQNQLTERNKELFRMNAELKKQLKEKENIQKNLRIAKEAAEQMNKVRSDFPATLSHEMRTPLNGIMGLSLMIQENSATPELKEFAALQIESTKRMTKTLNRVLELAKIQNNGNKPAFDSFDLNLFIEQIIEPLRNLADKKSQKLLVINHEKNKSIVSDQVLLEQIIVNLVTNSIKYTPEKGVIQLNFKIINKNFKEILEITVEDNGIGVSLENKENIFDPFFQEAEVTKQNDNSSGLGLYLVKKYSEYLNGKIRMESEKGEGTLFMLQFPLN
jgi:two-component system, chemotaxis family, sensor kinase Cph1